MKMNKIWEHNCNDVLWIDDTNMELLDLNAQCHFCWKSNAAFLQKHLIVTVKHCSGGVMIWACFAATGPQCLVVTQSTMKSLVYQSIVDESALNVTPSTRQVLSKFKDATGQNSEAHQLIFRKTKKNQSFEIALSKSNMSTSETLLQDFKRAVHKPLLKKPQ